MCFQHILMGVIIMENAIGMVGGKMTFHVAVILVSETIKCIISLLFKINYFSLTNS